MAKRRPNPLIQKQPAPPLGSLGTEARTGLLPLPFRRVAPRTSAAGSAGAYRTAARHQPPRPAKPHAWPSRRNAGKGTRAIASRHVGQPGPCRRRVRAPEGDHRAGKAAASRGSASSMLIPLRRRESAGLIVAAHLANWEILAVIAAQEGLAITTIVREPNNPLGARDPGVLARDRRRRTGGQGRGGRARSDQGAEERRSPRAHGGSENERRHCRALFRPSGHDRAGRGAAGAAFRLPDLSVAQRASRAGALSPDLLSAAGPAEERRPRGRCPADHDRHQRDAGRLDSRAAGRVAMAAPALAEGHFCQTNPTAWGPPGMPGRCVP